MFLLVIYAVLSGLIPPPVIFFPGSFLNTTTFTQWVGLPPWIFRTIISLVIAVTIIRALEIFNLETERRIEEYEQQKIIANERDRLARELHDGTIQKVYTAVLFVESASRLTKSNSKISSRLDSAASVLNDTIAELRQYLVELHAHAQSDVGPLSGILKRLVNEPRYNSRINLSLNLKLPETASLSSIRSNHVLAFINEALTNAIRHAQANNIEILARDLGKHLIIVIKDDGVGLPHDIKFGNGLRNMHDRARLLDGTIDFTNTDGTTISLEIPWKDEFYE